MALLLEQSFAVFGDDQTRQERQSHRRVIVNEALPGARTLRAQPAQDPRAQLVAGHSSERCDTPVIVVQSYRQIMGTALCLGAYDSVDSLGGSLYFGRAMSLVLQERFKVFPLTFAHAPFTGSSLKLSLELADRCTECVLGP